ncbi:MAG: M28 family peptidase, partial [Planctomycetota bacterium]|nr:M28 family peptidase [Planctomycetota bacterium]
MTRRNRLRLWIYGGLLAAVVGGASYLTWMPGPSTPPPEVRAAAPVVDLAGLAAALRRDVAALGGERNVETPDAYRAAAAAIETRLKDAGYAPTRQTKTVDGVECANIECALSGGQEIVVVGAHYDSVSGSPGANDNGS